MATAFTLLLRPRREAFDHALLPIPKPLCRSFPSKGEARVRHCHRRRRVRGCRGARGGRGGLVEIRRRLRTAYSRKPRRPCGRRRRRRRFGPLLLHQSATAATTRDGGLC
jgi:hypothetical protein